MELATAALGSLLPKLATLLSDEYKLQKRVRGEIRFLQAEMESMQAALERVSRLPAHQIDDLNKIWVRDLKELVYDIEDSVDAFKVSVDGPVPVHAHSFRKFFDRTMGLLTKIKNRHHMGNDIQEIKRRIEEVTGRRERYRFEANAAQPDTNLIDPRVLASFEHASKLVGTDGPTERISNLLTQGKGPQQQKLMVVSIVGVGGLGKTTIANMVYERLGGQFDCKAFVSVSLKPNVKQIFSSILRQISKDICTNIGEKDPEELIRSIRQFLMDKKYLIVIDDVWEEEAWKTIMSALIDMNHGSRVIVTTRNVDIANLTSVDGALYELDPLSDEDSKRLLCTRIFNEEQVIHSDLEEVTTKILKKCGGIPLAIITVSSMLACIPNKTKYEWYGAYNSMGSGLEKDKSLKNMRKILYLSYGDLPSYLKSCLLYLSMFPEDSVIRRNDLIRLWVAEGFVDEKKGSNLYDLGEIYFSELINRSMIQPVDMNENGSARACRVHDMVLDLIIYLAAQENFAMLSEGPDLKTSACKIRRLSLQGSELDTDTEDRKEGQTAMPATVDMSHVRSLIALGDAFQWMQPLSRFSVLRVLVLELSPSKNNDPKDIFRLHHLRYLELRGELATELLEHIGNLQSLRTLDLWGTSLEELPPSIVQLKQLERLITDTEVKFPDGIGHLVCLQQLAVLDVEKSPNTLAELVKLTELRVLDITGLHKNGLIKTFLQSLINLNNIVTLNFVGCGSCSLDCMPEQWRGPAHLQSFNGRGFIFSELPRWFSSLCELSCLSICVRVLRQVDIQLLGALPVLRFLKLQVDFYGTTEERLVIGSDKPFRSLAEFEFTHYSRCWLVFGQGVMPRLQRLKLSFEAGKRVGGGFDVGMENLPSLKHVTVKVNCDGARTREVEDAETKIRDAVDSHPNHPTLVLSRICELLMAEDENEDVRKGPDSKEISSDLLTANDEREGKKFVSHKICTYSCSLVSLFFRMYSNVRMLTFPVAELQS
ncbi:disease resistance protein RGA5 isoform X1 [Setaria viridis]|uniref:disease resistance protein RGA5 isoform X1 n=1 Tax=Setaria viridis TaxID=4556 RepID=UPI001493DD19|nr:disease resistance protein RGA5-like isoform X1 [Setaria viridis]